MLLLLSWLLLSLCCRTHTLAPLLLLHALATSQSWLHPFTAALGCCRLTDCCCLCSLCFFLLALFGGGGLLELWDQHQEVEAQRNENARLRERNEALNAEVLDLKQGLDAVEEHAREDLGMVKEGEVFYQVVE